MAAFKVHVSLALLAFSGLCAAQTTPPPSFPVSGSFLYTPRTRSTIAALELSAGQIKGVPLFGKSVDLNAFMYAGSDLTQARAAAGFGVNAAGKWGPSVHPHLGLAYGTVVDGSPHFSIEFGVSVDLTR